MNGLATLGPLAKQPHLQKNSRYIHFSHNTQGNSGRPVFIDTRLMPTFLSILDLDSYVGQEVVKSIEQLRSIGGGIASFQCQQSANQHKNLFGKVEVYYYIEQSGAAEPAGIFISNVRAASSGSDACGLYKVKNDEIVKHDSSAFSTDQACIGSGTSKNAVAYKASRYVAKDTWDALNYELYFIPDYDYDEVGTWITPSQKLFNEKKAISNLEKILKTTQQSLINTTDHFVKIRVFDKAAKILDQSLSAINGHLDKLGFEFIDPDSSVTSAITKLNKKSAKLSMSPIKSSSKASLLSLARVRNELALALKEANRLDSSKEVLVKTKDSTTALIIGNGLSQKKNFFLAAARQANLLGKWQK